ncbi:TolC family protein [Parvularcula sp. LCG005]|uniref:TolC family protein n=1 Tax=Parvularcula sp. LCG005 TaxID=3078805 RepID=UPI002941FE0E|nr:TolC family protein [Parvularcula sp. LCG005]WOI52386.1 TolC family protein [Parvularcula sp. LCG005]
MNTNSGLMAVSALALAALTGCVTQTPEKAMQTVEMPTSWTALSNEAAAGVQPVTANWIGDLNDPATAMLIDEAIARNNNLAAAAARTRAARERVGVTRAGLLPSLRGEVQGASRNNPATLVQDVDGTPILAPASSFDNYSIGFGLNWELDLWGRLTDQTRAAYAGARASAYDLAANQLSVAGGTAQAYYALTEASLQRRLSERDVETGEANLRIIERRYERGISSSLDVRLARSSLSQSQATLIARQQTELETARRLEVLLGRYPRAEIAAAETLPTLDDIVSALNLGDPESLLVRRPDIMAAERRLKAAGLQSVAARKALLPSLSVSGSLNQSTDSSSNLAFDIDDAVQQIFASLTQPIFQGGRLRAQSRAAQAEAEAAMYDYAQTALAAFQEVENAVSAERLLSARAEAQRLAFEEAQAVEDLTNRQYVNGTANIFDLINAQQRRISSESAYIASLRARLSNRINLYLALGAPFETSALNSAEAVSPFSLTSSAPIADDKKGARL